MPSTGPSTSRSPSFADPFDADGARLPPHYVVTQLDAVHHRRDRRPVGEHRDDDVGAVDRLGGGADDGRAEPLRLLTRAVPGADLVARACDVARHRRAHDPGAEEGDRSKAQHRSDAAQRHEVVVVAHDHRVRGLLDRLLDRRLDDVVDRLAVLGVSGSSSPAWKSMRPEALKFSEISSVSTRAWLSASSTSSMPAAPRPPRAHALRQPVQRLALALAHVRVDQRPAAPHTSSSDAFSTSTAILPAIRSRRYGCSLPLNSASSSSGRADQDAVQRSPLVDVERELGGVGRGGP